MGGIHGGGKYGIAVGVLREHNATGAGINRCDIESLLLARRGMDQAQFPVYVSGVRDIEFQRIEPLRAGRQNRWSLEELHICHLGVQ